MFKLILEQHSCLMFFFIVSFYQGFGALAALKRKRKKFSKSRNTSPVLEPATLSKSEKVHYQNSFSTFINFFSAALSAMLPISGCFFCIYQMLKRASSVPTRVEDDDSHGAIGQQKKSPESSQHEGLTPSTTDESVKCSTALLDPLLRQTHSLNETNEPIPHLPNITPVRGHINYQGWL